MTDADLVLDEVKRLSQVFVPACLTEVVGPATGITVRGCRAFLTGLREGCDDPADRTETLLVEQLELLHFARSRILALMADSNGRALDIILSQTVKLSAELRKTAAELETYRASRAARNRAPDKTKPSQAAGDTAHVAN